MSGRWVVIGGGNMGGALLRGALAACVWRAESVVVAEPDAGKRETLAALGVGVAADVARAMGHGEVAGVLLAVKPQMFAGGGGVAQQIVAWRASCGSGHAPGPQVVSIMAGVPVAAIARATGCARVIRAMPNLPATLGAGMTALAHGAGLAPADGAAAERLFAAVGRVVWIDELLMDAYTAVAGSGPAYVFALVEALSTAGIACGLDPATADAAARQTVIGAGRLLEASTADAAGLRAGVTSKGGTTEAALAVLKAERWAEALARAVAAAARRGRELGEAARVE